MADIDRTAQIIRRMHLRDLRVFLAVAQTGSMAKASESLRITQPSVSKTIKNLETDLGVQLFERSARGVVPSVFGNALVTSGLAVFDELRQGMRSLEFLADPTRGELRVGCVAGIPQMEFFPAGIERFRLDTPHALLHVDELPSRSALLVAIRERKYDLGLFRVPAALRAEADLNMEVLFDDRIVIVAGSHHRLARRRKVEVAELEKESWIMASADPQYYQPLIEAFGVRGLPMPKPSLVTLSVSLRTHLLATGHFVAPFSEASMPLVSAQHQPIKKLRVDVAFPIWPVTMVTLKGRTLVPLAERFMECIRASVKEFV